MSMLAGISHTTWTKHDEQRHDKPNLNYSSRERSDVHIAVCVNVAPDFTPQDISDTAATQPGHKASTCQSMPTALQEGAFCSN